MGAAKLSCDGLLSDVVRSNLVRLTRPCDVSTPSVAALMWFDHVCWRAAVTVQQGRVDGIAYAARISSERA